MLHVSGDEDPLHPRWIADHLAESLPDTIARTVPPRYLEPLAHEEAVDDAVRSFLGDQGHGHTPRKRVTTGEPT